MQYKNFYIELPVKANNVTLLDGVVQADTANIVHVQLMDGDKPFDFEAFTNIAITVLTPTLNSLGNKRRVVVNVSSDETFTKDNPYMIQTIDPKSGRLDFALLGSLTETVGQYFAEITIYDAGEVMTSARINYRVRDSLLDNTPAASFITEEQLDNLQGIFNKLSSMISTIENWTISEKDRENEEIQRGENEQKRTAEFERLSQDLSDMMATIRGDLEDAERFAQLAYEYSKIAERPTDEAINHALSEHDIPSRDDITKAIEMYDKSAKELGDFADGIVFRIKQGIANALRVLTPGELGFTTDDENLYIGSHNGNICITQHFVVSDTPPSSTKILWIDSLNNNSIKFYDTTAEEWKSTATNVFA